MSKGFSVTDILGAQSKASAPAGQPMKVVMLPISDIQPNPQNAIYEIGDVGMLQADIAEHGLRTPLEVAPAQGGKYMLIAGHRRHTACLGLHDAGDKRFDLLPCVITDYGDPDEELVALITSNATARELTDGERLRQYEALRGALTRLKAEGKVNGRVREELARRTGEGSGTLARLNAISARCIPEVKQMLEKGEITFTRAYECSKLYKVQQVKYAKKGYSDMPEIEESFQKSIREWLLKDALRPYLQNADYGPDSNQWNYLNRVKIEKFEQTTEIDGQTFKAAGEFRGSGYMVVQQFDPSDPEEVIAEKGFYLRDLFQRAKCLYMSDKDRQAEKQQKESSKSQKAADAAANKELEAEVVAILGDYDNWHKVAYAKELGLVFRELPLHDGTHFVVGVDVTTRKTAYVGMPYDVYIYARFDKDGNRVDVHDGKESPLIYFTGWRRADGLLENFLKADIKKSKAKESVDK